MFILFKAPPEKDLEWEDADVEGQFRFLNRVWQLVIEYAGQKAEGRRQKINPESFSKPEKELRRAIHTAIKEVTEDLDGEYQFNTAVSELMKLSNALKDATCKNSPVYADGIHTLLILLAPFAPHIADELWHQLGHSDSVHQQSWLQPDPAALVADEINLVIQISGKTRGTVQVPAQSTPAELEEYARASDIGKRYVEGKEVKKVIVPPGNKLINFVIVN